MTNNSCGLQRSDQVANGIRIITYTIKFCYLRRQIKQETFERSAAIVFVVVGLITLKDLR